MGLGPEAPVAAGIRIKRDDMCLVAFCRLLRPLHGELVSRLLSGERFLFICRPELVCFHLALHYSQRFPEDSRRFFEYKAGLVKIKMQLPYPLMMAPW